MKYKILVVLLFLGSFAIHGNERELAELKDPGKAVGLSLGGTLLPSLPLLACATGRDVNASIVTGSIIMSISGFIIGPSAGHFYAENSARGYQSISLRFLFALVGAGAVISASGSVPDVQAQATILIASGICILGSAAYDILTCPQSVEKYNQSILDQGGLYFSPKIDIKNESYGFSLTYRF